MGTILESCVCLANLNQRPPPQVYVFYAFYFITKEEKYSIISKAATIKYYFIIELKRGRS